MSSRSSSSIALPICLAIITGAAYVSLTTTMKEPKPEATDEYELWGRSVQLGIPKHMFPTPEELKAMEDTMPGCQHGWFTSSTGGSQLHYRKFLPKDGKKPSAIVVFHHGISSHSGVSWITSNGKKLSLALMIEQYVTQQGMALYAMDQLGHGYSEGRRMFISDYKDNVADLVKFTKLAAAHHAEETPLFLKGHSFGGCLVLPAAVHFQDNASAPKGFKGITLVAPAIEGDMPPPPIYQLLRYVLAPCYPTWTPFFMPDPVSPDRVWRDPEALALNMDPRSCAMGLYVVRPFMLGTALQLVVAMEEVRKTVIPALTMPFCSCHGTSDYGVPVTGTDFLEKKALTPKADQMVLRVDGGYHDLLADPASDETMECILAFMKGK
jgi:acylglycerol lipase